MTLLYSIHYECKLRFCSGLATATVVVYGLGQRLLDYSLSEWYLGQQLHIGFNSKVSVFKAHHLHLPVADGTTVIQLLLL